MKGETISRGERREVVLLADQPQVSITWSRYAPGERGPDLHIHREHTDAFYVLDGELTVLVGPGGERLAVRAGGFVAVLSATGSSTATTRCPRASSSGASRSHCQAPCQAPWTSAKITPACR